MSLAAVEAKFVGFLKTAGKDFEKGLTVAIKYAPEVTPLVNIFFPGAGPAVTADATTALNLIQNAVISVEQKYAAAGVQNGTGTQKAEEVMALAGPAATALLAKAGVATATTSYVSSLITAVVGVLNVTQPPAAAAVAAAVPAAA